MANCFHCGLPAIDKYKLSLDNTEREFCCVGCQAVAQVIVEGGLSNFYQYRDAANEKVDEVRLSFSSYDDQDIQCDFVSTIDSGLLEANLYVNGISCAACTWLIEHFLMQVEGVESVAVNGTNHFCQIRWRTDKVKLSEIFAALHQIGYRPIPAIASVQKEDRLKEQRISLLRLGLAGLGMMQVGMVAIALYAGAIQGMDQHWQDFLRWVSLIFATPVIVFSAQPFFKNAYRALRLKSLNMDVSVSIALVLAFTASVWATVKGVGEVYYDSVSMFTFFLLLGRFFEMRARHANAYATEQLTQLLPQAVEIIEGEDRRLIPLKAVQVGQTLRVAAGDIIPIDGVVSLGQSQVDESILTGESLGELKNIGDPVYAGTSNGESALQLIVQAVGADTQLSAIEKMVNQAQLSKPPFVSLVDRIASKFVACVLLVSLLVGIYWWFKDPSHVIWVMLSVLVVTCPCALSLATPAALTAGTNKMRKLGLLIRSGHVLESLTDIDHIVFDKTGTLTEGNHNVDEVVVIDDLHSEQSVLAIIASLESVSSHPIAKAFKDIVIQDSPQHTKVYSGLGIEGEVAGELNRFGNIEFVRQWAGHPISRLSLNYPGEGLWQVLVSRQKVIAWVKLIDATRDGVSALSEQFAARDIEVSLLSGDREENVNSFALANNISTFQAGAKPDTKLDFVHELQNSGKRVLMVGDGINDVLVLSGANVSVAMGHATQLAQTNSDAVLLSNSPSTLISAFQLATKVRVIVKQNLGWALGYNLLVLPAAALGLVPPYLAAIGMSLSSLVVVINALRLGR